MLIQHPHLLGKTQAFIQVPWDKMSTGVLVPPTRCQVRRFSHRYFSVQASYTTLVYSGIKPNPFPHHNVTKPGERIPHQAQMNISAKGETEVREWEQSLHGDCHWQPGAVTWGLSWLKDFETLSASISLSQKYQGWIYQAGTALKFWFFSFFLSE